MKVLGSWMCYLRVLVTLGVRCSEPSLIAEELLLPSGSSRSLLLTSIRKTCWSWNRSFMWFIIAFIFKFASLKWFITENLLYILHSRASKKKSSNTYVSLFNAPEFFPLRCKLSFHLMKTKKMSPYCFVIT